MKIAVVTYENRPLSYLEKFRENHTKYCDLNGYEYFPMNNHILETTVPPWWLKVFIIKEYLQKFDIVMWIDSDAMFESLETKIESLFENNCSLVISHDKPHHRKPSKINTGVFASNRQGIPLINSWIERFKPNRWKVVNKQWICTGEWAGPDYEQGSLIAILDSSVEILPWYVLNNHPRSGKKGYVYHFCGSFGKKYLKYT